MALSLLQGRINVLGQGGIEARQLGFSRGFQAGVALALRFLHLLAGLRERRG